jgi:outer membrane receptor protein involved in Fe transport
VRREVLFLDHRRSPQKRSWLSQFFDFDNKGLFCAKSLLAGKPTMNVRLLPFLAVASAARVLAQSESMELPQLLVYSPRVAIQEPIGTFPMPVSALRFEPLVDVQARNLAEGQADIAIRGGVFENTGFRLGALSLYDPQTGHYFAEIPVAPAMISAPVVLTGAENAARGWNANAGTIAYGWQAIRTRGALSAAVGEFATRRGQLYQGWVSDTTLAGRTLAADAAVAYSESAGSRPFGDHEFARYNARVQLAGPSGQTDLFYGYQSKFFGWPNLYTPFAGVFESENLQTNLVVLNHRETLATDPDDFVAAGGYYRRNKDNYIFNRTAPAPFPFFHTTWVYGAGAEARVTRGEIHWNAHATFIDEAIRSSSLKFGRFRQRRHAKLAVTPERTWALADERRLTLLAGAAYDKTNRVGSGRTSAISPIAQLTLDRLAPSLGLDALYVSYAESTQSPTYTALNSNPNAGLFRGNPNLAREDASNLELGMRGSHGAWTATAALFHRRSDDLVDWTFNATAPNASTIARTANPVDIETTGVELVARYGGVRADLIFGYTSLMKDADYGAASGNASYYALNFPKHRLTAAAIVRLGAGFEVRMDNELRLQKENILRKSDDEAWLASAGVYYSPAAIKGLRLSVEVENLWDSEFEEVPAVPSAQRQISAGLTYAW